MKLNYHPDTDSLYIDLSERPSVESREVFEGVVLDYDSSGRLVGIDIDNAANKVELQKLILSKLPARSKPTRPKKPLRRLPCYSNSYFGQEIGLTPCLFSSIRLRTYDKWSHSHISLKRQRLWRYARNIPMVCDTDGTRHIRLLHGSV
jgi:uncharacterized protein YuzE